jgi:hypothetical protein
MNVVRSLGFGVLLAGAAAAYYVQRAVQEQGISYGDAVRLLPARARSLWADARGRATLALEEGRQAAQEREGRVQRELAAAGSIKNERIRT